MTAYPTVPVVGHAAVETGSKFLDTAIQPSISAPRPSMASIGQLDATTFATLAHGGPSAMNGLVQAAGTCLGGVPASQLFLQMQLMLQQQQLLTLLQAAHQHTKSSPEPLSLADGAHSQQHRQMRHVLPPIAPSTTGDDCKAPRPPSPPWQRPLSPPLMFGRRVRMAARRVLNKPPSAPRTVEAAKTSAVGKLRTLVAGKSSPSLRKNVLLRAILAKSDADRF